VLTLFPKSSITAVNTQLQSQTIALWNQLQY